MKPNNSIKILIAENGQFSATAHLKSGETRKLAVVTDEKRPAHQMAIALERCAKAVQVLGKGTKIEVFSRTPDCIAEFAQPGLQTTRNARAALGDTPIKVTWLEKETNVVKGYVES